MARFRIVLVLEENGEVTFGETSQDNQLSAGGRSTSLNGSQRVIKCKFRLIRLRPVSRWHERIGDPTQADGVTIQAA